MTKIFSTYITIARPLNADDPGRVEPGFYTVADGSVTLTNQEGKPITSGRVEVGYCAKIAGDETPERAASRLLWRHYRATKSGSDFNRPLPRTVPPGWR
jgi:hypothetical protein